MGCGLKKQNTETGVHLTERTCSPYNPIIKQIVDDCLGLPIYPVTSVDAVIDEEGNTLRKLLEDGIGVNSEELINYINSKLEEASQTYVTSNQFTTLVNLTLPDTYADKNVVNTLKTLVWAISALSNIRVDNEDDLYADDNKTPRIVEAVTLLLSQMKSILGQGSEDTPSLGQLSATVNLLKEVLIAVASFNEGYNPSGKLGLEGNQLQIIKEILDIKASIGDLDNDNTSSSTGNIVLRINYLSLNLSELGNIVGEGIEDSTLTEEIENNSRDISGVLGIVGRRDPLGPTIALDITTVKSNITTINETLIKKANLDPELYALCSNLSGDAHGQYKKLKASEYPVTSVYIFGSEVKDFLTDLNYSIDHMFIYFPKGTKFGAQCGGGILNYDFNEDGVVNWRDVATYIDFKSKYNVYGATFESAVNLVECSSTFAGNQNYWDVDGDGSIGTLGDLNALTDLVLKGTGFTYLLDNSPVLSGSMTSLELSDAGSASIFEIIRNTPTGGEYPTYSAPTDNAAKNVYMGINEYSPSAGYGKEYFKVIRHPAIDGKLYFDLGTNTIYRYQKNANSTGVMISTKEEDLVCQYLGAKESPREFLSGQNVVTVKQNKVLAKPSSIDTEDHGEGLNVSTLKYSIADVTALINFLLNGPGTTSKNRKLNVQTSVGFDLQNIKASLISSAENISGNMNLANYDLDASWLLAQTKALKTQVIVNAIRTELLAFSISDTDLSISQIKTALSNSNIPMGNYESYPKPTVTPGPEQLLSPGMLLGSSKFNWPEQCYVSKNGETKLFDIPTEGQVRTDLLVAKHDINLDGVASIADVTSLINLLLNTDAIVKINPVYYNYTAAVITGVSHDLDQDTYTYEVEEIPLNPGKKVFLIDRDAEADPDNEHILKYKRSYIDYDNCLLPDLDDYHLGLTVTGWTTLEHNGLIVDIVHTPIFLDLSTNKVGLIQGDKTIYFTINGNTADITVTDTLYSYGGEQL